MRQVETELYVPSPKVFPGELITKVKFDRSMYRQWHDKAWDDTISVVMGIATSEVQESEFHGSIVTTDTTVIVRQVNSRFINPNNREFHITTKSPEDSDAQNGIIIVNQFAKEVQPPTISDMISLTDGKDYHESTIVGSELFAQVYDELIKPRGAEEHTKRAQRVAACLVYALGLLDGSTAEKTD